MQMKMGPFCDRPRFNLILETLQVNEKPELYFIETITGLPRGTKNVNRWDRYMTDHSRGRPPPGHCCKHRAGNNTHLAP